SGDAGAERRQLGLVVAKAARLRRAPARARDRVPLRSGRFTRLARAWIDVQHEPLLRELAQRHRPLRGLERELRQHLPEKVVGRAVVLRYRQIRRERVDVPAHATPHTACAARAYTSAVFTSPS